MAATATTFTVRVLVRVGDRLEFMGSGFLVSRNRKALAVTNAHVIEKALQKHGPAAQLYVRFTPPLNDNPATLSAMDRIYDVALLGTGIPFEGTRLSVSEPRPGDRVSIVGFSESNLAADLPRTLPGEVIRVAWHDRIGRRKLSDLEPPNVASWARTFLVRTSSECEPGASGSPVFDAIGQVVGYLVGRNEDDGTCIVYSAQRLREILSAMP
ncbi:trypsin-like peptidase domain-containing protein [bacterium]|nr:trypsin-like peptidase domain-containing protein [bacterium]